MLIPQELQLSLHPSYIPILHPDIYCSNWLLVMAQFENLGELVKNTIFVA